MTVSARSPELGAAAPTPARGRLLVAGFFVASGALNALWGATLAATDARLDLGAWRLGMVLLALSIGALVAMPAGGWLADRWTSHRLLRIAAPLSAATLLGPALAPSFATLIVAIVLVGILQGALNIALTMQAADMERLYARPIMSTMHATWGVGAVLSGALTAAALHTGADVRLIMAVGSIAMCVLTLALSSSLPAAPPAESAKGEATGPAATPRFGLLILLGLIGAAAFLTEGAATDWAGVHARRVLGADVASASLMYTVFFVALTGVRFIGDALRGRLGASRTIKFAGLAASSGYALILVTPALDEGAVKVAMVGWAMAGAGMALVWPIVSSAVAGAFHGKAKGLSAVTTLSFGGGLLGPAIIGYVASGASLPIAMIIPAVLAVMVAIAAPAVLTRLTKPS